MRTVRRQAGLHRCLEFDDVQMRTSPFLNVEQDFAVRAGVLGIEPAPCSSEPPYPSARSAVLLIALPASSSGVTVRFSIRDAVAQ